MYMFLILFRERKLYAEPYMLMPLLFNATNTLDALIHHWVKEAGCLDGTNRPRSKGKSENLLRFYHNLCGML